MFMYNLISLIVVILRSAIKSLRITIITAVLVFIYSLLGLGNKPTLKQGVAFFVVILIAFLIYYLLRCIPDGIPLQEGRGI